jgi:hypothetical protein
VVRKVAKAVRELSERDQMLVGEMVAHMLNQLTDTINSQQGTVTGPPVIKILVEQEFHARG